MPGIFYKLEFEGEVDPIRVLVPVARRIILPAFALGGGDKHTKREVARPEKPEDRWFEFSVPDEAAMIFKGLLRLRGLATGNSSHGNQVVSISDDEMRTVVPDDLRAQLRHGPVIAKEDAISRLDGYIHELVAATRVARDSHPDVPAIGDLAHSMAVTLLAYDNV